MHIHQVEHREFSCFMSFLNLLWAKMGTLTQL